MTEDASRRVPTRLTCPGGGMVGTDGGLLTEMPDGFSTRSQAVRAWLADAPKRFPHDYVISSNGKAAWLRRQDGTAVARLHLLRHSGFTVYGYESCS